MGRVGRGQWVLCCFDGRKGKRVPKGSLNPRESKGSRAKTLLLVQAHPHWEAGTFRDGCLSDGRAESKDTLAKVHAEAGGSTSARDPSRMAGLWMPLGHLPAGWEASTTADQAPHTSVSFSESWTSQVNWAKAGNPFTYLVACFFNKHIDHYSM